jgi:hypothetical protein
MLAIIAAPATHFRRVGIFTVSNSECPVFSTGDGFVTIMCSGIVCLTGMVEAGTQKFTFGKGQVMPMEGGGWVSVDESCPDQKEIAAKFVETQLS